MMNTTSAKEPNVFWIKALRAALDWVSLVCASTGTNACENAPSAKSRLRKLGILKATKKASMPSVAPNTVAKIISRANPMMRDRKVKMATTSVDLKSDDFFIGQGVLCLRSV